MSRITINGRTYTGNSISINNNVVIIDGVAQDDSKQLSGIVRIEVTGDLASLETDASVNLIGNVDGDVSAGGSVSCGDVFGNVNAGGSVSCNDISGSTNAGGSIKVNR